MSKFDGERGGMYEDGKWVVKPEGEDQIADVEDAPNVEDDALGAPDAWSKELADDFSAALKLEEEVNASKRRIADLEDIVMNLRLKTPTPSYRVTFESFTTPEIEDAKSKNREDTLATVVVPMLLELVKVFMGEHDVSPQKAPPRPPPSA